MEGRAGLRLTQANQPRVGSKPGALPPLHSQRLDAEVRRLVERRPGRIVEFVVVQVRPPLAIVVKALAAARLGNDDGKLRAATALFWRWLLVQKYLNIRRAVDGMAASRQLDVNVKRLIRP